MAATGKKAVCPNCGSMLVASYCADCGQNQTPARRRWRDYAEELFDSSIGLQSASMRSLVLLLRQPGMLSKLKLENRGTQYAIPVKLFFVVLILYGLFFALSPIKFGQLYVGMDTELGYAVEGDGWRIDFIMYHEALPDVFSPGFVQAIREGRIDAPPEQLAFFERAIANPRLADEWRRSYDMFTPYTPLILVPAFIVVGLVTFRRKRYIADHIFVGLEATTVLMLLVTITGVGVFLLRMVGVVMDEFLPFLVFTTPVFLFWLYSANRNFYGMRRILAVPKALAVVVVYAVIEEILDDLLIASTINATG